MWKPSQFSPFCIESKRIHSSTGRHLDTFCNLPTSFHLLCCLPECKQQQQAVMAGTSRRDPSRLGWAHRGTERDHTFGFIQIKHFIVIYEFSCDTHHGQAFHLFTSRLMAEVMGEKLVYCGGSQIKGEHFKHQMFHPQNLLLCISVVCDVDKLCHLWRVDFFKFSAFKQKVTLIRERGASLWLHSFKW